LQNDASDALRMQCSLNAVYAMIRLTKNTDFEFPELTGTVYQDK
jgi:hypothetical protein